MAEENKIVTLSDLGIIGVDCMIALELLGVDRHHPFTNPGGYQRPLKEKWLSQKMAEGINTLLLGRAPVAERVDGSLWLVDNQQRCELCRRFGIKEVPCTKFPSTGQPFEAGLFDGFNKKTPVACMERFHAQVSHGDVIAVQIKRIVDHVGFVLTAGKATWPNIQCIDAMRTVFNRGGAEALLQTLTVMKNGWPGRREACEAKYITPLGRVVYRFLDQIDIGRLTEKLASITPQKLTSMSHDPLGRALMSTSMAEILRRLYNSGLRGAKRLMTEEERKVQKDLKGDSRGGRDDDEAA